MKIGGSILVAIVVLVLILIFTGTYPLTPPVRISFRPSMLEGKVLQVTNTSRGDTLQCTMSVSNSRSKESNTYSFRLPPGYRQEIGILEANWRFDKGETVSVRASGYAFPLWCTVP